MILSTQSIVSKEFSDSQLDPELLSADESIICISFRMTVGDLIDSTIMQILPIDFARALVNRMLYGASDEEEQVEEEIKPQPTVKSVETSVEDNYPEDIEVEDDEYYYEEDDDSYYEPQSLAKQKNVKVKPAAFASLTLRINVQVICQKTLIL